MYKNSTHKYHAYSHLSNVFNKHYQAEINEKTIDQFIDEYIEYVDNPDEFSPSYQRSINLTLRHFKNYFGGDTIISNISEREYENFFRFIKQTAPKGFRVYYRTLKSILSRAVKWNYLEVNYLMSDDFKRYKPYKKKPIYINKEDFDKILNAMTDTELKNITIFAYYSGCRVSEIINLKWLNVDFSRNLIRIGDSEYTTKDKEDREIPLSATIRRILENQSTTHGSRSHDYIFINQNGRQFRADNISKRFKKAVRKVDVNQHLTFHNLRGSFISNLANRETNLAVIQQLSGHNSLDAITPYLAYEQKHLQDAVKKLDEL